MMFLKPQSGDISVEERISAYLAPDKEYCKVQK